MMDYEINWNRIFGFFGNEMGHQLFDLKSCFPNEYELPSGRPGEGDAYACQIINFLPLNKNADWTIGVVLQHHQS